MENHIAVKRLLSGVEDSHTEIEAINPCKKFKEIKTSPIDDGLIRLIIGHLQDIGYTSAADCLAQDSKLTRSSSSAKVLEQLITVEKWTECCKMLTEDPCSVVMVSDAAKNELLLLLHLQEYFDLILRGDYKAAVMFVRQNMKKFHQHEDCKDAFIALLYKDKFQFQEKFPWYGVGKNEGLVKEMNIRLSSSECVTHGRLQEVVACALNHYEKGNAQYNQICTEACKQDWMFKSPASLKVKVPQKTQQVLCMHKNEVLDISFSPTGNCLASLSMDGTLLLWELKDENYILLREITNETTNLYAYIAWSHDELAIACTSNENGIVVHQMTAPFDSRLYNWHTSEIRALAWIPYSVNIVSAGVDDDLLIWNSTNGKKLQVWSLQGIKSISISPDGLSIIAACMDRNIRCYSTIEPYAYQNCFQAIATIHSICLSQDSQTLLVNEDSKTCVNSYDFQTSKSSGAYVGMKCLRYEFAAVFGGYQESLVACGSEDARAYIWQRSTYQLIASLEGHSGPVNRITWHPKHPYVCATCSDDQSIRIWTM